MPSAMDDGGKHQAGTDVQSADALRTVELVGGDREQVDSEGFDVERNPPRRLYRVGVKEHTVAMRDLGQFADRLQSSGDVVGGHDRNKPRVGPKQGLERGNLRDPLRVHRQVADTYLMLFEVPAGLENRRMLDRTDDDMSGGRWMRLPVGLHLAARAVGRTARQDPAQREIVRLGSTPGEDDRIRDAIEKRCDLCPRPLDRLASQATGLVQARRVAGEVRRGDSLATEVPLHRLRHPWIERCRGCVVQIDPARVHGHSPR